MFSQALANLNFKVWVSRKNKTGIWTQNFQTRSNSNSIEYELDPALLKIPLDKKKLLRQWPLFLFRLHFLLGCMEKFITREHVFSKHRDFQIWTLQLLDLQLSVAKNRLSSKSWIGNLCCWSLRKDEFLELDRRHNILSYKRGSR